MSLKYIQGYFYLVLFCLIPTVIQAQYCIDDRFGSAPYFEANEIVKHEDVFLGTVLDLDGNSVDLLMDIYEPSQVMDGLSERPFFLYLHGGGYLTGDQNELAVEAQTMARSGYVSATISYRLGWQESVACEALDGLNAAMYRSIQDANLALDYFSANALTYKIDSDFFFIGGQSAGANTAMHLHYLDQADWDNLYPEYGLSLGPVEANPASWTLRGISSMWGAILDTTYMETAELLPTIYAHSIGDIYGHFFGQADICAPTKIISGTYQLYERSKNQGSCTVLYAKSGDAHVAYTESERSNSMACFFKQILCNECDFNYKKQVENMSPICVSELANVSSFEKTITSMGPYDSGDSISYRVEFDNTGGIAYCSSCGMNTSDNRLLFSDYISSNNARVNPLSYTVEFIPSGTGSIDAAGFLSIEPGSRFILNYKVGIDLTIYNPLVENFANLTFSNGHVNSVYEGVSVTPNLSDPVEYSLVIDPLQSTYESGDSIRYVFTFENLSDLDLEIINFRSFITDDVDANYFRIFVLDSTYGANIKYQSLAGYPKALSFNFELPALARLDVEVKVAIDEAINNTGTLSLINSIQGMDFNVFFNSSIEVVSPNLALEIFKFEGKSRGEKNYISWEVNEEETINNYILESSVDGNKFKFIQSFEANGSGLQIYNYIDEHPFSSTYYHLRMVYKDGSFEFSPILLLKLKPLAFNLRKLYPNSFNDQIFIEYSSDKNEVIELMIYNNLGQIIEHKILQNGPGIHLINLNVKSYSSGIYFLELRQGDQKNISKLIKTN